MNFAKPVLMRTNPGMDRFIENQRKKLMPYAPSILKPAVVRDDIFKPRFIINSLDKQNNLDRTQGVGDYKPIPSATFNGAVLGRVLQ